MSERVEATLGYAARGWLTFPLYEMRGERCACGRPRCSSPGKHPRIDDGLYGATLDEKTLRKWFTLWPHANIGIRTGPESGLLVLDVDADKGGEESLFELEQEYGELPATPRSHTGGGGQHVLFAWPGEEMGNRAHFRPGLDIRGSGGYIVTPPSNHRSGHEYAWDVSLHPEETRLAEMPPWLLSIIRESSGTRPSEYERRPWDGELPERVSRILAADARVRARFGRDADGLSDRSGSGVDFSLACLLARHGLPGGEIEAALRASRAQALLAEKRDAYYALTVGKALATSAERSGAIELSDMGNAERLVQRHGEGLRYVTLIGQWLVWDERRWAPDQRFSVQARAKETIRSITEEAQSETDAKRRAAILKHALRSESHRAVGAMIELARSEPSIPIDPGQLNRDPWLLNVANGTVDLRTGELSPHRPEDLVTKLAPVEYEPGAHSELWETFLKRVLPDIETWTFFQRAVGYSLVGEAREEVLFFVYGPTAAGKSTALEAVKAALGDYALTSDFETFLARREVGGPRSDIARLAGARLVTSIEVEEGKRLAEGLIKNLTGGDSITVRQLYREEFEFRPQFTLWLAANHRPRVRDDDAALWRRILQIPFSVSIPEAERDSELKGRLQEPEHRAAVLAWAVEGCLRWQREGLAIPDSVRQATAEYRAEMDPLIDFLEERCVESPTASVSSGDLWDAYLEWCRKMRRRPLSRKALGARLTEHGFLSVRSWNSRGWSGLGLLDSHRSNGAASPGGTMTDHDGSEAVSENSSSRAHAGGTFPTYGVDPSSSVMEGGESPDPDQDEPWWQR